MMVLKVFSFLAALALVSLPTCSATVQQEQAEKQCVEFDSWWNATLINQALLQVTIPDQMKNVKDELLNNLDNLEDKLKNVRDKMEQQQDKTNRLLDELATLRSTTMDALTDLQHQQNKTNREMAALKNTIMDGQDNLQDNLQDKVDTLQVKVINLQDKLDVFQNTTEANTRKNHHEVVELLQNTSCSLKGILCPQLTNPENGQVVQPLCANFPGSVANYFCDPGYKVFGNVSRECVSMGLEAVWTGEAPTCQRRIVCSQLTNPEDGQVVQLLGGNVPGTVANYSCDPGYKVFGNMSRECVSMGLEAVWTGEAPTCQRIYSDCKDEWTKGQTTSGIYTIQPDSQPPFQAYCDMDTDGGGWTVLQRRRDGSVDFYRYWSDYQQGFGNLSGEFWLGLEKIHRLTSTATQLRVDLQDFHLNSRYGYAKYTSFSVGDSASKYTLSVSGYSGTAGDSLGSHDGRRFSTRDQDNDNNYGNCAQSHGGAWWFNNCHLSHLNGPYQRSRSSGVYSYGVDWYTFTHWLKFSEMKVRRN